tara:strand:- start:15 stop:701 length:687 start_codon:yes stop_codon:yes gene_type:complete
MNHYYISLGTDCLFKTYLTELGYKKRRKDGEKTCPFDLAIHSYGSVLHFLKNGFDGYIDSDNLYINDEGLVCCKKWKSVFVHESNSFKDVAFDTESSVPCWKKETLEYNFIDNDYHHLKERYERRVRDFESLVRETSVPKVFCYHTRDNNHCAELYDFIKTNYPNSWLFVLNTHYNKKYEDTISDKYIYINCCLPDGTMWNSNNENSVKVKKYLRVYMEYIKLKCEEE